jgi:hypothetical protein
MNNYEIAEKVANELHRFGLLKDYTEITRGIAQNRIKELLDFEERREVEKHFPSVNP